MLSEHIDLIESLGLKLFFVAIFLLIGLAIQDVLKRGNVSLSLSVKRDDRARLAPEACSSNSSAQPAARKASNCGARSCSPVLTRA